MNFYNRDWISFGTKHGLQRRISEVTGIPIRILCGDDPSNCSVARRMSWASKRVTTRPEDLAYCLLGLFDVNMPMLYGEGKKAFRRLQEEIVKTSEDHSIFAWSSKRDGPREMLAQSPADFEGCGNIVSTAASSSPEQFSITNAGLSISFPMIPWAMNTYLAILECRNKSATGLMPHFRQHTEKTQLGIFIQQTQRNGLYIRVRQSGNDIWSIEPDKFCSEQKRCRILISLRVNDFNADEFMYGFLFRNWTARVLSVVTRGAVSLTTFSGVENYAGHDWPGVYNTSDAPRLYSTMDVPSMNRPVRKVELSKGQQGTVVSFNLNIDGNTPRKISTIRFGFDFNFNPVCIIFMDIRDHDAAQQEQAPETSIHETNEWIKDEVLLHAIDASSSNTRIEGSFERFCILRGDRHLGLHADLTALNMQIRIEQGWEDANTKAWVVHIYPLKMDIEPGMLRGR